MRFFVLSDDFREFIAKKNRIVVEMVANLESELIKKTPVGAPDTWKSKPPKGYRSGQLKRAWDVEKLSDGSYIFSNNMEYAESILRGIRIVPRKGGGTMQVGSKQLPDGVAPILQKHNEELDARLKLLKG